MIDHTGLRKGAQFILDGDPYEVLESSPMKKAQRRVVIQTKIKNLLTGSVVDRNFHQGDTFEEAELVKFEAKFLYSHKDRYFFCNTKDASKRFDLGEDIIGNSGRFLKQNQVVDGVSFQEKIINIILPVKVQLRVKDAPPGVRGDRAQGGTKAVVLETGATINVPLFIQTDDIVEINTESGEYVRRAE